MFRLLYQCWSDLCFKPISPIIICLYRIVVGLVSLSWGLLLAPNFLTWFSRHGILSLNTIGASEFGFRSALNPIVWFNPDDPTLIGLLCIYLAATLCLTIGCCTRLSNIVALLLMLSFCNRNPLILNGGDALLRLNLFILAFAPAGRMLSVDNWLRTRFAAQRPGNNDYEPWTQRLLQLQLGIVYWEAFWAKLNGHDWWNGTAVYYVTHLTEFHFLPVPYLFDHVWTCRLLSWGTLLFELSMWSLIWFKPFRYWLLLIGLFVHLGFNWSLNIPLFQFVMLANYVLFIEPADAERAIAWLKSRWTTTTNILKPVSPSS